MNEEALKLLIKSWETRCVEAKGQVDRSTGSVFGAQIEGLRGESRAYKQCIEDLQALLDGHIPVGWQC